MKLLTLLTFLLTFLSTSTYAGLVLSSGTSYQKINDSRFKFKNEFGTLTKFSNINLGYSKEINNFNFLFATNRFFNKTIKREVVIGNNIFLSKTKSRYDVLQIGYRKKALMPAVYLANTKINTTIIDKEIKHAILYGLSFTFFFDKNMSTSITYLAPNQEFNLDGGMGWGVNYNF